MRRLILIVAVALAIFMQSCTLKKVENVTQVSIDADGVYTVVEANKNTVAGPKIINVETSDGVLRITGGNSETMATIFLSHETVANLEVFSVNKAGVYCDTLHLSKDGIQINVTGNGSFAGYLITNNVVMNLHNEAYVAIMGNGGDLTLTMTGKSKYTSPSFEWQNANVTITDTAKCTIKVVNSLTVNASGHSNLGYIGVLDSNFVVTDDASVFRFPVNMK